MESLPKENKKGEHNSQQTSTCEQIHECLKIETYMYTFHMVVKCE